MTKDPFTVTPEVTVRAAAAIMAAGAMLLSSLSVIGNSMRLNIKGSSAS